MVEKGTSAFNSINNKYRAYHIAQAERHSATGYLFFRMNNVRGAWNVGVAAESCFSFPHGHAQNLAEFLSQNNRIRLSARLVSASFTIFFYNLYTLQPRAALIDSINLDNAYIFPNDYA